MRYFPIVRSSWVYLNAQYLIIVLNNLGVNNLSVNTRQHPSLSWLEHAHMGQKVKIPIRETGFSYLPVRKCKYCCTIHILTTLETTLEPTPSGVLGTSPCIKPPPIHILTTLEHKYATISYLDHTRGRPNNPQPSGVLETGPCIKQSR